jgi:ATP-dependent Lon protease
MFNSDQGKQVAAEPGFALDRAQSPLLLPKRLLAELISENKARDELASEAPWTRSSTAFSETEKQSVEASVPPATSIVRARRGEIRLYDKAVVQDLLDRVKKGLEGRGDRAEMIKRTCQALLDRGEFRKLAKRPRNWLKRLDDLIVTYPNGAEVFKYLKAEILLAEHSRKPLQMAALGLEGLPGVGKSVIVEAIQGVFGCPLYRVQVEISSHASALTGTERHWSNAGPGLLFQALALGEFANPIVMLDELEKVQTRDDYPNVHKVLYSLLERASSRKFRDASLPEVSLDASNILWIGTANSLAPIPAAIKSRMRFFHIPALTQAQSQSVLLNIDARLRRELRLQNWPPLSGQVVERLASESPRRMGILLRAAFGQAVMRSDQVISLQDIPSDEVGADEESADSRRATAQYENLLTLTNFAALRALEIHQHIATAERLWSYANTNLAKIH